MIRSSVMNDKRFVQMQNSPTKDAIPCQETSREDLEWWRTKIRREEPPQSDSDTHTYMDSYTSRILEETISVCSSLSCLTMFSRKRVRLRRNRTAGTPLSELIPDVICLKVTKRRRRFGFLRWRKNVFSGGHMN